MLHIFWTYFCGFGKFQSNGINHNGQSGFLVPSTSLMVLENGEKSEPKSMVYLVLKYFCYNFGSSFDCSHFDATFCVSDAKA